MAGGLLFSYGQQHRVVLDVLRGPMAASGATDERGVFYYGPAVLVGWEWMSRGGFAVRSTLGVAVRPGLPEAPIHLAANPLSLDFKFF